MAKFKAMWNGFWRYRYLLWNLVSRDFKLKYRRSVLGVVWSVLNPLLMCLVYWAVFSSLMDMRGSGIDNFAVFLMCGQLLFNFFNEATSTGMSSVLGAAPLLKKVYIPKYIFPLEKCCFAMVNCVFSFVALLLVSVSSDWTEIGGVRYPNLRIALTDTELGGGYTALWGGEGRRNHERMAAAAAVPSGIVPGAGAALYRRQRYASTAAEPGARDGAAEPIGRGGSPTGADRA